MTKPFYFILIFIFCQTVSAEGFDLFDEDRNKPKTPPTPQSDPKPPAPPVNLNPFQNLPTPKPQVQVLPQKDFELKGISQIGKRYIVFLEAPNNKIIKVDMEDKIRTAVNNGFPDYYLIRLTERKVKVDYPENAPCLRPNPQKGIKCSNAGKSAILEFTVGKAINPPPESAVSQNPPSTVNPFLAAMQKNQQLSEEEQRKREEALEKRRELYKNFKRQVIKDEDVPEGMRVVRTPFGDRLVPDKR